MIAKSELVGAQRRGPFKKKANLVPDVAMRFTPGSYRSRNAVAVRAG
jgi:hypothetical protein